MIILTAIFFVVVSGTITTILLLNDPAEIEEEDDPVEQEHVYLYPDMMGTSDNFTLGFTHLENAGMMIETHNLRIYVDPIELNETYSEKPADIIFLTHNHNDHYNLESINYIKTNETSIIAPKSCSQISNEINDVIQVSPGNISEIMNCSYEVIKAYTPLDIYYKESLGYCGYILELENFTIFFGGDSDNIPEYQNITKEIEVVFLDAGDNRYTIFDNEAVEVISILQPKIFKPIHTFNRNLTTLINTCNATNPNIDILTQEIFYLI